MQKIPTLYLRDEQDRKYVTDEVNPECQWVLAGEGVPHIKRDGTCVGHFEKLGWVARREVKEGRQIPDNFALLNYDEITGKSVGWEPIDQSPFYKMFHQAFLENIDFGSRYGTYELCGPKINGNPEGLDRHTLFPHTGGILSRKYVFWTPKNVVRVLGEEGVEGVVWHHSDGRMAKLKARDLRL